MRDKYVGLKRLLAFVASIGLWGVSMYFSYKGFEFESTTVLWFGVVMALVVTVVELVFNTRIKDLNPTLVVSGMICYVYGVYTNITGFYILQHGTLDNFFSGSGFLIPIVAGLLSEVLPEALFAWALGAHGDGDFVGNVMEAFQGDSHTGSRRDHERIAKFSGGVGGVPHKAPKVSGVNFPPFVPGHKVGEGKINRFRHEFREYRKDE